MRVEFGVPDVVVGLFSFGASMQLLRGLGDGTLAAPEAIDVGSIVGASALADLDGDGRLDLLALRYDEVIVVLNTSGG